MNKISVILKSIYESDDGNLDVGVKSTLKVNTIGFKKSFSDYWGDGMMLWLDEGFHICNIMSVGDVNKISFYRNGEYKTIEFKERKI